MRAGSPLLDAVLELARRGWCVLPLHGKTPIVEDWPNFATTDEQVIRQCWSDHPDANVGVAHGAASGTFALDVDGDKGERTLTEFERQLGALPETAEVATGREDGGRHLIFAHPKGAVITNKNGFAPGLDCKSNGGQTVMPPSIHPDTGAAYRWLRHPDELNGLPELPAAWVEYLSRERQKARSTPEGGDGRPIPEGRRHDELLRLAGAMRRVGAGEQEILAALAATNETRCRPSLPTNEVRRLARDIPGRYAPKDPEAKRSILLRPYSTIVPQDLSWLWPGRIPLGKVTLIVGDPGLGKSYITLDIASRVSCGGFFSDGECAPRGSVLLLSAEDDPADTIRPRLDAVGALVSEIHEVRLERAWFSLSTDLPELERALENVEDARLVVIDPISAYLGDADSHRDADVRALLGPLAELAQAQGVAIVCVAHLNKNVGVPGIYRVTGSLGFVAAARATWGVVEDPETPGRCFFLPVKVNLGPKTNGLAYRIEPGPEGHRVDWEDEPVEKTLDQIFGAAGTTRHGAGGRRPRGRPADCRRAAEAWLLVALADGPVEREKLLAEAEDLGHAESTVKRAASVLGVVKTRASTDKPATWALPGPEVPGSETSQGISDPTNSDRPSERPETPSEVRGPELAPGDSDPGAPQGDAEGARDASYRRDGTDG